MKTIIIAILLTFTLSAFAKDKTSVETNAPDIYTSVRDILK